MEIIFVNVENKTKGFTYEAEGGDENGDKRTGAGSWVGWFGNDYGFWGFLTRKIWCCRRISLTGWRGYFNEYGDNFLNKFRGILAVFFILNSQAYCALFLTFRVVNCHHFKAPIAVLCGNTAIICHPKWRQPVHRTEDKVFFATSA